MCGIAASVDLDGAGRATPWALAQLRHRGPDGEGVVRAPDGNVVLEHCRLAIIDPNNREADQPFSDPTGRWTIVYNGELFNFREIAADLRSRGVRFRTESDTEVLLLGFIHEGERLLERLQGMFAFVIWDRVTGDVFAARDQLGVKPLYYRFGGGRFVACSEVRPLLNCPGFDATLDPVGVVEFLAFGKSPGERTVVDGVRKLPPGHWLRIRDGRMRIQEYWDALPGRDEPRLESTTPAAELLERLDAAVSASLVSDVPLGLMLSGGIDSSAIAALACRHVPPSDLTAYSVNFGLPDDEAAAAASLARDLGIRHRTIEMSEGDVAADFDSWLSDLDYPGGNPTWIASSFIARGAHADGIKVLLSGDGADEVFGGYSRWMKYLRFHDTVWARVPQPFIRAGGRIARPALKGLAADIARRAAVGGDLFVTPRPFHDDALDRCLGPTGHAAAATMPPERYIEDLRRRFDERLPGGDYLAWMSYASLKTSVVEDFLGRLDKMGMRHSVEGRVPLLDPNLVRWVLPAAQEAKIPRLRQKAALRDAVEAVLAPYVLQRPKLGFCAPVGPWVQTLLEHRPLGEGALFESGLLKAEAAAAMRSGGGRDSFAAWTIGILAEWTNLNLDKAPLADFDPVSVAEGS